MTDDEYRKTLKSVYDTYNYFESDVFKDKLYNRPFSPIFYRNRTSRLNNAFIYDEVKSYYTDVNTGEKIEYTDVADPIYAKLNREKDKNQSVIIEMVCTKDLETDEIVYMTEIELRYNPRILRMVIHK